MASAAAAIDQAASPKPVDESLWWESFVLLFEDIDNAPLSSDLSASLVQRLKSNHVWLLDSVARFKPPNGTSRLALDFPQISVGSHRLHIKPELKELALSVSSSLCLDEVQSYILINRSVEIHGPFSEYKGSEFLHLILIQYYLERQCLLKCIRRIFMHALFVENESQETDVIRGEALRLIRNGLENKLLQGLQDLLSSAFSERAEVDLTALWVEETLIEDNLVLDILFLVYYENFCSCNGEQWKKLCLLFKGILSGSFNVGKLAVSVEARSFFYHAKVQLLLILIETLDLDNLLRMVHDEIPFRLGCSGLTLMDVQEIDVLISSLNVSETVEAGPLILAWAVFLCLIFSLPDRQDYNMVTEIDHVGYVRQAFAAAPFNFLMEILHTDSLRDSDGPVSGFLNVLRTFISAFIASFEITNQLEDNTLNLILDILCQIYRGEESLCMQFWDRDSYVDSPIRSLLCLLESEFPYRTVELVRLLSSLCEGAWPAKCVYNFLDNMGGITTLFEIPGHSYVNKYEIVEASNSLHIPGVEGLVISSRTRGRVLKIIDGNIVLVRWEIAQSGVFLLLLRLLQEYHSNSYEELYLTLDLLYRMTSFNTALCFTFINIEKSLPVQSARLSGHIEENVRVDVVKIICTLICNLVRNISTAGIVSLCFNILSEMLKCLPSHVIEVTLKANIFGIGNSDLSGAWLLSGGLARMILADCEQNGECCPLTLSVLEFTMRLVEKRVEDNMVSALIVFSLQYVLVNHENWKYKVKYSRWRVTVKVFEVMKKCIKAIKGSPKLGYVIRGILFSDSSIHNVLCRVMCITTQTLEKLYVSRLYELKEIEGLQLAICSALDIVFSMLTDLTKETTFDVPIFVQTMLSSTTKPIPLVTAAMSLISFFRNTAIQVSAARVLSMLCFIAARVQPYSVENVSLIADIMQVRDLSSSIYYILDEQVSRSEDLLVAAVNLLTSAARYQPAFFVAIISSSENREVPLNIAREARNQLAESPISGSLNSKKASIMDSILQYVNRSKNLFVSGPRLLLSILNLLKALWEGGIQHIQILERMRNSEMFWKHLSTSILAIKDESVLSTEIMNGGGTLCSAYRYQCQAAVLDIVAHDIFLHKKLFQDEILENKTSGLNVQGRSEDQFSTDISKHATMFYSKDTLLSWCESSVVESLIKIYSSGGYDNEILLCAKMAVSLCIVHLISKVSTGDAGSLCWSLVEKIRVISKKLSEQAAFSTLLAQYSLHGYSEGKDLTSLILHDLYYHLQGELESREITPGPFKELSKYLLELEFFQSNKCKDDRDLWPPDNDVHLFDISCLQEELGIEFWDHSDWKASKSVAEGMLSYMRDANLIMFLADSKHCALKALADIFSVYEGNVSEKSRVLLVREISDPVIQSSVEYLCNCLPTAEDSLVPALMLSEDVLNFFATQVELLLTLSRSLFRYYMSRTNRRQFLPVFVLLIKTSAAALRFLTDVRTSFVMHAKAVQRLLTLLLISIEFSYSISHVVEKSNLEVEQFAEASLISLGLLPVLCKYAEAAQYCNLSIATIDIIIKGLLTSDTWLPVLQKHLQLQLIIHKLQQKDMLISVSVILKFILTLVQIKGGAKMLQTANFFPALKVLFTSLLDEEPFSKHLEGSGFVTTSNKDENAGHIWGLGLAIITSMIYSLGDDPSCTEIVDSAIPYFFFEKAYMMSYYLSAPNFPTDDHNKKRARTQMAQTSLTALRETERTLMLICALAKHQASWIKGMKEMDSELRETIIHILAFISKGTQRIGDTPNRTSLLCPPILIEEIEANERPSFVNSRHGWLTLCALGLMSKAKVSTLSSTASPLEIKDQTNRNVVSIQQTYFSDTVAIQIYRIAYLLLKFLCMQAKAASKRAEEVEFIDLAHFPELPMPEILHGLQDQVIIIVTEVCETSRSKPIQPESQSMCLLMLQILEKSLYLELCVSQSCGIRPVLGRVEDFSREIKVLMQVAEEQLFLRASLKSLRQIVALVYPGLLQTAAFSDV